MSQTRSASRGVTINLRADQRKRSLIDRAAETVGKNRSEFMLDAACREATSVLLDQRLFLLDEKAFRRFNEALDKAPADNPRLRRLVMRQLTELGYQPLEADGPAAALAMLEAGKVELLFSDIVMPGPIDGIGLAQQASERWPDLKIVLTSGFPGTKLDDQLGQSRAKVRLLGKPYRKEDLARVLNEALEG